MEYLCLIILGLLTLATVTVLFCVAVLRKQDRSRAKKREEQALNGIGLGISERLYAAYPGSKWRWECRPAGFAVNGGIGRIDVLTAQGKRFFVDVCLSESDYMALHVLNVTVLAASETFAPLADFESPDNGFNRPVPTSASMEAKSTDEEGVATWYNIVLIDALTSLIDDLHAKGDVCLYIGQDGKVFVEETGNHTVIYEFGDMPDLSLWGHITEKLGCAGLFAEVQEEGRIFVSWA